ncbi:MULTISPECIES: endonuclease/exonuclease/phosphatase family protein [Cyanophyceae]|uniref:endonuclease/exonuclease/phosphatase family protein n=1 Tax=Cyanophyceae TaxID=3028117 RepID=UPI0016875624|nr:endonuclease/exonuclease/phosphatase family protein [Trichocoleus sp. FACHB-69]MBD1931258.1 endonuclease/exonuclease/phosphatase family protein [Trichocoleus sp. FACHB-69]
MDVIARILITLSLPGFILLTKLPGSVGDATISTALGKLGSPLGAGAGLIILVIAGLIANALSKIVVDGLLIWFYQKRCNSEPEETLLKEIDNFPLSTDLKIKLKWAVTKNPIRPFPQGKRLLKKEFTFLTVVLALFSLAGYFGRFHKLLELTSHFKLQYLILSFCPFILFLLRQRRKKLLFIITILCIILNLLEVLPWYIPQPAIASEQLQKSSRFLLSNVYYKNESHSRVISLVREEKPDVAVFLEVNNLWSKELEKLQDILPYTFTSKMPEKSLNLQIYSKVPLENTQIKSLGEGRPALLADVTIQGKVVSIIATHPNIPTTNSSFKQRNQQFKAIGDYVPRIKNLVVLIGDLNTTMWSPFYQRMVDNAGLINTRQGFGILPTWKTPIPWVYIPLDHCLVSPEIQVKNFRRGRDVGSDHLPVIADLVMPKKA